MALAINMELCLPRDTATVPLVRHVLKHTLLEFGVTRACVADIELAVTEACANVVEHTAGDDEYELTVQVTETTCEIRIVDTGHGFDYREMEAASMPSDRSERGRGLALIHAIVDVAEFESIPERGTVVHLVKQLDFTIGPFSRPRR